MVFLCQVNKCDAVNSKTNPKYDNWKENKKTEDYKFKKRKRKEKTEIELSVKASQLPCIIQKRMANIIQTVDLDKTEIITIKDSDSDLEFEFEMPISGNLFTPNLECFRNAKYVLIRT